MVWDSIREAMLQALNWLYGLTGDYGLAIVLFTIGMRLVLMPLTIKQTKSMYELQRIQPKIKELQEKYKNDKEKLQAETMRFYEENKVNPFGGCLPLLVQMPILIALFNVLSNTAKNALQHPEWNLPAYLGAHPAINRAFWIILPDITFSPKYVWDKVGHVDAIAYIVLALLFGLSVWLPQQLQPGDKQQKNMGMMMAAMMVYFGWISPAGVLIYWVTSSAWQVGQQVVQTRLLKNVEAAEAEAIAEAKASGPKGSKKKAK